MLTCSDCKHWGEPGEAWRNADVEFRTCTAIIFSGKIERDAYRDGDGLIDAGLRADDALAASMAYVVDGEDYLAALHTCGTFGCTKAEPREC